MQGCAERDGASVKASFHQKTMPALQTITAAVFKDFLSIPPEAAVVLRRDVRSATARASRQVFTRKLCRPCKHSAAVLNNSLAYHKRQPLLFTGMCGARPARASRQVFTRKLCRPSEQLRLPPLLIYPRNKPFCPAHIVGISGKFSPQELFLIMNSYKNRKQKQTNHGKTDISIKNHRHT